MLGMHGTYEANLAMYNCDVMINIGARFDDRVTGRISDFSPHSRKIHVDIDPSSINKNVPVDVPVIGDAATVLARMIETWKRKGCQPKQDALARWWEQIDSWRARDCLAYSQNGTVIKPQHAIRRLFEKIRGARLLHHHRSRPAPDVGGTVLRVRGTQPLDDLGRARHHGLRPCLPRSACRSPIPTPS